MNNIREKVAMSNGTAQEVESAAKAEETKSEKFIWLGEYHINKSIDAISRIEHFANRSAYDYTPKQVEAMFSVLESKVAEVKAKFTVTKVKEFSF